MNELIAFLNARLDEDEAAAHRELRSYAGPPDRRKVAGRTLREVAAKRAILGWHQPEWNDYRDGDGDDRTSLECKECEPPGTPDNWPCRTILAAAAVYSDHPDYRPEWATGSSASS